MDNLQRKNVFTTEANQQPEAPGQQRTDDPNRLREHAFKHFHTNLFNSNAIEFMPSNTRGLGFMLDAASSDATSLFGYEMDQQTYLAFHRYLYAAHALKVLVAQRSVVDKIGEVPETAQMNQPLPSNFKEFLMAKNMTFSLLASTINKVGICETQGIKYYPLYLKTYVCDLPRNLCDAPSQEDNLASDLGSIDSAVSALTQLKTLQPSGSQASVSSVSTASTIKTPQRKRAKPDDDDEDMEDDLARCYLARPQEVTIHNLRETVFWLSQEASPLEWRELFQHQNPFKYAIWQGNLLTNPDDIIPANYDKNALKTDLILILSYQTQLAGISENRLLSNIDYVPNGSVSQLVYFPLGMGFNLRFNNEHQLVGKTKAWYTPYGLPKLDIAFGVLGLFVEWSAASGYHTFKDTAGYGSGNEPWISYLRAYSIAGG